MSKWVTSIVVLAVGACTGPGPATGQEDVAHRTMTLVRQLDDDRVERREAAESALIELGPDILDLLPGDDLAPSAEVRERLARIRGRLQSERARQFVAASTVQLRGEMSAAEALQAIQQQTGNRIIGHEPLDGRVTVDFQATPFWPALDQVLDQVGATLDIASAVGPGLRVVPGGWRPTPQVSYGGVFRLQPTLVAATRDLRHPELGVMRVRVRLAWEPRITPIVVSQRFDAIIARDDQGHVLDIGGGQQGTLTASVERDVASLEWEIPLGLPSRSAQRLTSLTGTFEAVLPGRVERFEFDTMPTAMRVGQRRAGVVVTVQDVRATEDAHEVFLRVAFDEAHNALESHRGWIYRNDAYLIDTAGQRLDPRGVRITSQDADAVGLAYTFSVSRPLADYRFVYETPSLLIRLPVSYELTDIDLP